MASLGDLRKRSEGNWFWLNNQILDLIPQIGNAGLAVYVVLAFHANNRRNAATLYHRTIAEQSGWKVSKVKMALDLLVKAGAIQLQPASKRGQANTYYLLKLQPATPLFAAMEACSEVTEDPPAPTPQGEVAGSHVVAAEEVAGSHVVADPSHVVTHPSHVVATLINKTSLKIINKTNTSLPPAEAESLTLEGQIPVSGNGTPPLTSEQVRLRFRAAVVELIDVAYKEANGIPPEEKGKVPWGARAMNRLDIELKNYKAWALNDWQRCISNRFASDGIIPGEPPDSFIPYLKRYTSGPLNQYGSLKGAASGNIGVNARAERNRAAGQQVDREISAAFARLREEAAHHPGSSNRDS
jgi:hypothetical protein